MGTNRYAYSDNDPVNKSDTNGHSHDINGDGLGNLGGFAGENTNTPGREAQGQAGQAGQQAVEDLGAFQARKEQLKDEVGLLKDITVAMNLPGQPRNPMGIPPGPASRTQAPAPGIPTSVTTPIHQGAAKAPNKSTPNSIYEQVVDGKLSSRAFYDNQGRQVARQDFSHSHYSKQHNQNLQPHEHNYGYGPRGPTVSTVGPVPPGYSSRPSQVSPPASSGMPPQIHQPIY